MNEILEKTKYMLQSSLLLENKNSFRVLVAINSDKQKRMIEEDIQTLTGLDAKDVSDSINILEKTNYIKTIMEDVPKRSPHKVCILTDNGKHVLEVFNIN